VIHFFCASAAGINFVSGFIRTYFKENGLMSVEDKVKKIIAEKLGVDSEEVVPEASFVDDLGADSLDLVELIMSMEEEFEIEISDEAAEKLVSVKDAINYINAN